jgi:hypothetical protein
MEKKRGSLRVGRILNCNDYKKFNRIDELKNFTLIVVMTASSKYGILSPYQLKTENGVIIENYWQFSKVYEKVPKSKQFYSQFDKTVIWEHPEEKHYDVKEEKLLPAYYKWQEKGFKCKYAIRYPVGRYHRHKCLFSLYEGDKLDYIESRKKIYLPEYMKSVIKHPKWKELKDRLYNGENLLILEVDGPHQESLQYYKDKYKVEDDFIENETIIVNRKNMKIMLNDGKHAFGHGYCLAISLISDIEKIINYLNIINGPII